MVLRLGCIWTLQENLYQPMYVDDAFELSRVVPDELPQLKERLQFLRAVFYLLENLHDRLLKKATVERERGTGACGAVHRGGWLGLAVLAAGAGRRAEQLGYEVVVLGRLGQIEGQLNDLVQVGLGEALR